MTFSCSSARRRSSYAATVTAVLAALVVGCTSPATSADSTSAASVATTSDPTGPSSRTQTSAPVRTVSGPVVGRSTSTFRTFEGIPYAAPPVGALRWAAPVAPTPWTTVFQATAPGPACPQTASTVADVSSENEDCLRLNVTAPASAAQGDRLPVMVWVHGGGGTNGSGASFDPHRLVVDNDVVVVTVNYRLGIFGAFGYPGLVGSGGFGLQDQQAALRWVHANIAAFGGNPGLVTLFGESYGALSTTAQLTSPGSAGLFQRAAIQSDLTLHDYPAGAIAPKAPALPSLWLSQREVTAVGTAIGPQLGCADRRTALQCLRGLPAKALLTLSAAFTRFAYGNSVLPESPPDALRAGRFHRIPVLTGGTRDEHRLYTAAFYDLAGSPLTAATYRALLRAAFGADASGIGARYPVTGSVSPGVAWSSVITDRVWAKAAHEEIELLAAHVPTFAYEFADENAPPVIPFPPDFPPGAHHSSEVFYQFDESGHPDFARTTGSYTAEQRTLAGQMNTYWATFARVGDPNGPGLPIWNRYAGDGRVLALAPGAGGIAPVDVVTEHALDFWDGR